MRKEISKAEFFERATRHHASNCPCSKIELTNDYYVSFDFGTFKEAELCYCGLSYVEYRFSDYTSFEAMLCEIWQDYSAALKYTPNEVYLKAGNVQLSYLDCDTIARRGMYIVAYRSIWRLDYDIPSQHYRAHCIYRKKGDSPLMNRGRWCRLDAENVNRLVGFDLCTTRAKVEKMVATSLEL